MGRRVFAYNIDGQVGHLVNPVIEAIEGEQEDEEIADVTRPHYRLY